MLVHLLYFISNAMKSEMDSIPTASACNKLPLPSHPSYDVAKYTPPTVDRTQPKLIWCMCFIDPSGPSGDPEKTWKKTSLIFTTKNSLNFFFYLWASQTVLHIFETRDILNCKVQPLVWTARAGLNRAGRFINRLNRAIFSFARFNLAI